MIWMNEKVLRVRVKEFIGIENRKLYVVMNVKCGK